MILKALTLENFKGIREPVRIEFAPLTLLFGPNNAGKSTVVQALMYAREVLERNNCDAERTELGGDVVDLGGFRNLVHGHEPSRTIRMRFELDPSLWDHRVVADEIDDSESEESGETAAKHELESAKRRAHLDLTPWQELCRTLTQPWIELEIAQRRIGSQSSRKGPTVVRYAVGNGSTAYAAITLNEASGEAELSFVDNKLFPVIAASYSQGELTDFEWDLQRIARAWVRHALRRAGYTRLGLAKGATVALPNAPAKAGDDKMSREDFDTLVVQIVSGEGVWGDDAIDPETGNHSAKYSKRNKLIALAEAAGRYRPDYRAQFVPQVQSDKQRRGESIDDWFDRSDLSAPPLTKDARLLADSGFLSHLIGDGLLDSVDFDGVFHVPVILNYRGTALLPDLESQLESSFVDDDPDNVLGYLSPFIVRPRRLLLEALGDAVYLGPYRKLPSRHYRLQDAPAPHDWASGLAAWQLLIAEGSQPLVERVNSWLSTSTSGLRTEYAIAVSRYKSLDLSSSLWHDLMSGELSILVESIREKLSELPEETKKLELNNTRTGVSLAPQDLGVGVSQVIPVLVAALHNAAGIVTIEEPESNIHPAWQVVLADLFITQAKANSKVMFLVETHSEHLMLRCLRRIRETSEGEVPEGEPSLKPEDIVVHFVEPGDDGPRIHRIRIDENGEFLDPWPRGFFRERSKELYGDDL